MRKRLAHWHAVQPLPIVTASALLSGAVAAILIAAAALPARELAMEMGWISRPPNCSRLDRWTGDCFYTTRADGLTLEQAAAHLARAPADLSAANPSLPSGRELRRRTAIYVPPRLIFKSAR